MTATAMVSLAEKMKQNLVASRVYLPDSTSKFLNANRGKFTLPDGKRVDVLEAIILDYRRVYTFYKLAYNPSAKQKPSCMAIGFDEETDMRPIKGCPEPQTTGTCSECPQCQWGSGLTGKGRRCKNGFRIALAPVNNPEAKNVVLLSIPPTSIKPFEEYFKGLRSSDVGLPQVISRISFDPGVDYTKFEFDMVAPNSDLEAYNSAFNEAQSLLTSEFGLFSD